MRFWGYKSPEEFLEAGLGRLERQVMDVVSKGGAMTVRDVHGRLDGAIAYTTVMTTMDRLFKKGLLDRSKTGRAFLYRARLTPDQLKARVAAEFMRSMLTGNASPLPVLSNLVDTVGRQDATLLDELERLVRDTRKRLRDDSNS